MCPFLEKSEPRCAEHLQMRNIFTAFAHCADRYTDCPVYARLIRDARPLQPDAEPARLQSTG